MKILIQKQFNAVGGDFTEEAEIPATISVSDDDIAIEVDGALYLIPREVFTGIGL